jgi:DNA polymerase elongation subunit (family B)
LKQTGYPQNTQNVAALKRARDQDLAVHPDQDIEYVVGDDEKTSRERVVSAHEERVVRFLVLRIAVGPSCREDTGTP